MYIKIILTFILCFIFNLNLFADDSRASIRVKLDGFGPKERVEIRKESQTL